MSEEQCKRCGSVEEDLRTLHMACFYALEETGIPLEQEVVLKAPEGANFEFEKEPTTIKLPGPGNRTMTLGSGTVKTDAALVPGNQYTIRVCKSCRADWMQYLEHWWAARDVKVKPTGTGAYIRERGSVREMTQEEVEEFERKRGHPPARVKDIDLPDEG